MAAKYPGIALAGDAVISSLEPKAEAPKPALYEDDNGRLACEQHGGMYLQSELRRRPNGKRWNTPLGTWRRVSDIDRLEFEREAGQPMACETCRFHPR